MTPPTTIWRSALIAIAYIAIAQACLLSIDSFSYLGTAWLPYGLALAAMTRFGAGAVPGIFLGDMATGMIRGESLTLSLWLACLSALAAIAGGYTIRLPRSDIKTGFIDAAVLRRLVSYGVLGIPLLHAVIGSVTLQMAHPTSWANFPGRLASWWGSEALGILLGTPCLLMAMARDGTPVSYRPKDWLRAAMPLLLAIAILVGSRYAFLHIEVLVLLFIAALLWNAFSLPSFMVATVNLAAVFMALTGLAMGIGSSTSPSNMIETWPLQFLFVIVTTVSLAIRAIVGGELERLREALQHSDLRFRLASAGGQVWEWDIRRKHLSVDPESWKKLGVTPPADEFVAEFFEKQLHPDDLIRLRHVQREHLARRGPYELEFRARHANGEWLWFQTQGQAVWDADGRATYMAGTNFDITARKRAEESLRNLEAYQRSLFEQLADGVIVFDSDLRILDCNPQVLDMLGCDKDALVNHSLKSIVAHKEHARMDSMTLATLVGKRTITEWEHVHQDGSTFPVEVSTRALGNHRYLAVLRDITQRRKSESALLAYQSQLLKLSQRLLTQERTTHAYAQALHDQLGQTLAAGRLRIDAMAAHALELSPALQNQLSSVSSLLDQCIKEVRDTLARLRVPLLDEQGMVPALDNEIRINSVDGSSTDVILEVADGVESLRWPGDVEYGAFMVAREAVANALHHAGASLVRVILEGNKTYLSLDVIDDGVGIPADMISGRPGHLGMVGMRERSRAIGARFEVEAQTDGGTRVRVRWGEPGNDQNLSG